METEQQQLVKDVMMAVAEDKPKDIILSLAKKAKISLSAAWNEYQQAINVVDIMVSTYVREPNWVIGWWSPDVTAKVLSPSPTPVVAHFPSRSDRVLQIASDLTASGEKTITVKAIMEKLRAQGDPRPQKKMAISVGNILSWSGKWQRVASGKYISKEENEK